MGIVVADLACEIGVPPCGSTDDVHPYLTGLCCPRHTPAAMGGRPEVSGQDAPLREGRPVFKGETAIDQRHRDSGQRASGARRRASHAG